MRFYWCICKMFSTIICLCILSTLTILCVEAGPGARSQAGGGALRESQPAFTNYPQFPISPYFGVLEDFDLLRDINADNQMGKRLLQAVPSNKQDTKSKDNISINLDEPKQQPIVFNSETPPVTDSPPAPDDGFVSDANVYNDINNNHNIIGSDVNSTSAKDIWANVPLANVNGFIMPIVPPVLLLPRPSEETALPRVDHTGGNLSGTSLSMLDLSKTDLFKPELSGADPTMPGSSGANLSRKESSQTKLSGRGLSEIQPAGRKPSWSKYSRSPSLRRIARSVSSDADPLPVMCGEFNLVPGSSLHLASPYYPANYPDNFSCRWSIKAVAGEKVAVKCITFVLATGDYLAVGVEGDPTSLVRYTAARALSFLVLPSNEVFVSFFSDGSQQSKGFSCTAYSMGVENEDNSQPTPPAPAPLALSSPPPQPSPSIEGVIPPSGLSHPECGLVNRPSSRIVKGQPADKNEYPWQVYLKIRWDTGGVSGCGGSLISQRWVLTAAHCVMPATTSGSIGVTLVPPPKVTVLVGAHDINNIPASGAAIESSRVIVHPKNSFSYDLALIELSKSVSFGPLVRPVCLPTLSMQGRNLTGVPMAVIGWGNTETGAQPEALRELGQQGLEWGSCKRVYGDYITDHHFCTTSTKGGHICLGDSGGPTMIAEGGRYYIRGVISFVASKECNLDFPDGHTSVTHFLTWIKSVSGVTV